LSDEPATAERFTRLVVPRASEALFAALRRTTVLA
jgi:hypothetical protein